MDTRPTDCRFRLQDEGKSYPRSSCRACGKGILTGLGRECSHKPAAIAPTPVRVTMDAAKIIQKRIDNIIAEEGSREWDTGVVNLPEWAETAVEELEGILAALEAPAPAWPTNCAVCGRIVDTREKAKGGDGHGCEYSNGWACSSDCAEKLNPDPEWMRAGLAALEPDAGAVAELVEALRDIADPKRLTSHGDPAVLRNHAAAVLAKWEAK